MSKIFENITDIIGNTPLLNIKKYKEKNNLFASILVKLEYLNPSGSVKDRAALNIIAEAEANGLLNKDTTIIEATSGNMGIGLASVAAAKGYKAIFAMPENMSIERQNLLRAYGAKLKLTPKEMGMPGAIQKAKELMSEVPNSFMPSQFENYANVKAHYLTTGPEIWEDTKGAIDIFVAGVGSGGTITGAGEFLKTKKPNIEIVAVEPYDSPFLSQGKKGTHKIQGIGAGFKPIILNENIYEKIITVKNEDAFETGRKIAKEEGLLIGISSGAALWAATELAKLKENKNKNIVVILPDNGERYLSTELFH